MSVTYYYLTEERLNELAKDAKNVNQHDIDGFVPIQASDLRTLCQIASDALSESRVVLTNRYRDDLAAWTAFAAAALGGIHAHPDAEASADYCRDAEQEADAMMALREQTRGRKWTP